MKDWIECDSCLAEYRIISDCDETITYCPYCGEIMDTESDEDEDDEYDD